MSTRIFVSGLPKFIKESDIRDAFGTFGDIRLIYIPDKLVNDHSTCFIVYSSHEEASAAIHGLCYSTFGKQNEQSIIKITYGDEKTLELIRAGENKLIIENIPSNVQESDIYDTFNHFGEVLYCSMPLAITGKTVGVCFVIYRTKEESDKAIENMNLSTVEGKSITVRYAPKK